MNPVPAIATRSSGDIGGKVYKLLRGCQAKVDDFVIRIAHKYAAGFALLPPMTGAGSLLRMIRNGEAVTRADLVRRTGLARSTVAQRLDALLAHELVYEAGGSASTGGRPPTVLAFNQAAGVVLAADLGATHSRLVVSDLAGAPLAEQAFEMDIAEGPERVLDWVRERFAALLDEIGRAPGDVRGIGVGVPGPVAFSRGEPVAPPIMPGWDGFSIPGWFAAHHDAPVLVDNDVNIMALGEHWSHWRELEHLLFVKVGTGIGCGIVAGGRIHRGAQGAAGDIGHIRLPGHDDVVCRCGNVGCLEAVAGGRALAERLRARGLTTATSRDVVAQVRAGEPIAIQAVRDAGRFLGEVLAGSVNFFNPGAIVIGGDIAEAHQQLLAGVREVIFQRSLPLATGDLRIVPSRLGDRAGVIGAAIMVIEHVLAPEAVDRAIERGVVA
jgi:predicted NBD/HSP70 family sugar kinase